MGILDFLVFILATGEGSEILYKIGASNYSVAVLQDLGIINITSESTEAENIPRGDFGSSLSKEWLHHDEFTGHDRCTQRSLGNGFYYGVNPVSYGWAKRCCEYRNLQLTQLPLLGRGKRSRKMRFISDTLRGARFRVNPIGETEQLFVVQRGWKFKDACPSVHLFSPRNSTLIFNPGNCSWLQRYLCEDVREHAPCDQINFVDLNLETYHSYSQDLVPWSKAYHCCEKMGMELAPLDTEGRNKEIIDAILEDGKTDKSKEQLVWTSGHKRVEDDDFRYPDYNIFAWPYNLRSQGRRSKQCVAGLMSPSSKSIKFVGQSCSLLLPFVCVSQPEPPRCKPSLLDYPFEVKESGKNYYRFLKGVRMTYGDAYHCCESVGLRLLTVTTPMDGSYLAAALQRNISTASRYEGLIHGIWVGARLMSGSRNWMFPAKDGKPTYSWDKYSTHYIRGKSDSNCLSFVIDSGNHYALTGTPCLAQRDVICERPIVYNNVIMTRFLEVGDRYFFSTHKRTQREANISCEANGMTLYETKGPEETHLILNALAQQMNKHIHLDYSDGIWTGSRPWTIPLHAALFHWRNLRQEEKYKPEMYKDGFVGQDSEKWCAISFVRNGTSFETTRSLCRHQRNYMCELRTDNEPHNCGGLVYQETNILTRKIMFVSKEPESWFKAVHCCRDAGYELLVPLELNADHEDLRHLIKDTFFRPNIGFWTAGSNYALKYRFQWHAYDYDFVHEPDIFFHHYYQPNTTIHEEAQCLEGFYHETEDKIYVSNADCFEQKHYICKQTHKPVVIDPCEDIIFRKLGNTRFFLSQETMPWPRAAECCSRRKGVLARITNHHEGHLINEYSKKLIIDRADYGKYGVGMWLGLMKNLRGKNHIWLEDGKDFDSTWEYSNFLPDYDSVKDQHGKDCVGVTQMQLNEDPVQWRNFPCDKFQRALCYYANSTYLKYESRLNGVGLENTGHVFKS